MDRTVILASTSPRRRELFELLEVPFIAVAADIDETPRPGEDPDVLVARLSATKAAAVGQAIAASVGQGDAPDYFENSLVLAADTVVVLDGDILGKPQDAAHAKQMLRALRDREHNVHSGIAVVEVSSGRTVIHLKMTRAWMRDYSDEEIDAYVATDDPLDKAGAYAIQHAGFSPVERIQGCYTGVMGLPLTAVAKGLAHFGLDLSVDVEEVCRQHTGHPCCED